MKKKLSFLLALIAVLLFTGVTIGAWNRMPWGEGLYIRIIGGSINNTSIGQTTPAAGSFTSLSTQSAIYDSSRTISGLYNLTDKKYVDEAVTALGARYYMIDTASSEADYRLCSLTPSAGAEQSVSASGVADDQYLAGWISPNTNEPDKLIAGVYNWRIYAAKTSGHKTLRFYWKLIERASDDTETVIGTSIVSNEVVSGKNSYIIPLTLSSDHEIADGSYVVGKIYADVSGSGTDPDVTLYYEGDSDSHWEIPVNTEILDNTYVKKSGDTITGDLDVQGLLSSDQFSQNIQELTDGATISWDMSSGGFAYVTLGGNRTLSNPTNVKPGSIYILKVIQDATGSRTLSFDTNFKFSGGTAPTLTSTANAVDLLMFIAYDASTLYLISYETDLK